MFEFLKKNHLSNQEALVKPFSMNDKARMFLVVENPFFSRS
jgi:hypothetical protein